MSATTARDGSALPLGRTLPRLDASAGSGLERLRALIASCRAAGVVRQVLLLRLGALPPALTRPHHLRLAEAALAPLLQLPRAELFRLPGPALAVSWRGEAEAEVLDVADAIEHLLLDTQVEAGLPDLLSLYELPATADLLVAACHAPAEAVAPGPGEAASLDPAVLTLLEGCLAQADVARFARRQSVWHSGSAGPALAWEDRTLSVAELTEAVAPGYDLLKEPWLFRRLTRTLDRRVLSLLSSPGELVDAGPFALGLNVASMLGPEFLRFDASLPPGLRGRIVLGLSPADLLADSGAVSFACGFARARGYRTLLQAGSADVLAVMAPAAMDFDYVACRWAGAPGGDGSVLSPLAPGRLVLTGCDTPDAVGWGLATGITLFAGAAVGLDGSCLPPPARATAGALCNGARPA